MFSLSPKFPGGPGDKSGGFAIEPGWDQDLVLNTGAGVQGERRGHLHKAKEAWHLVDV